MNSLDFKAPSSKAFGSGFLKGLGATYLLYGARESSASIPQVNAVLPATGSGGLASDWRRIGQDMRLALSQYAQETATTK